MTPFYFIIALIIQTLLVGAEKDIDISCNETVILDSVTNKIEDDIVVKDFHAAPLDWMDVIGSAGSVYPTSSASMMAQAVLSDKPPEEQLEDIKDIASQIKMAVQSEMVNLLSYVIPGTENESEGCIARKKRSVETPTDSTKLVMRLLKHIKSNNDYQNIAIEKMMSAQEIADKYGIPFKADPEILTDLAVAGNEQANELTSILKDVCEVNNATKKQSECKPEKAVHNITYQHEDTIKKPTDSSYAYYDVYSEPQSYHYCSPVTPRPSFYDTVSYRPSQDYYSYCTVEPISTTSSIFDPIEPLPELVGEEIEETISSKIFVNDDVEPGSSTVSHVTSYTVSEKSHFRKPHIDALPQQMQYYFYLI
ncbi:uncharacterized protein LOC119835751 [Zerene cesonia]|uniref:uncharacterized protein LOC119835751 n=1 Tax=Zerene cesonia TaxID=33412 RepID=UPI0018E56B60|nr:uncharacterized protein LOC119835751 [Zerene cesonia]